MRKRPVCRSLNKRSSATTRLSTILPPYSHYYFKRAKVKYSLVFASTFYDLDGAIADMDRAIELEPDKGKYYRLHGEYLMLKLTEERYVADDVRKLRSVVTYK